MGFIGHSHTAKRFPHPTPPHPRGKMEIDFGLMLETLLEFFIPDRERNYLDGSNAKAGSPVHRSVGKDREMGPAPGSLLSCQGQERLRRRESNPTAVWRRPES